MVISGTHHVRFINDGTVLRFEPERLLAWSHRSSLSKLPDEPASYTELEFALSPAGAGTSLVFTARNFPTESVYRHLALYWRGTMHVIKRVAERIVDARKAGDDVVVVVSAMGDTTDELADLASQVSPVPPGRELDMLLTAGERISMALLATVFNAVYGLLLAWTLARYEFPGKRILDALVDVPFALPTAVAGLALTALFSKTGWFGGPLSALVSSPGLVPVSVSMDGLP